MTRSAPRWLDARASGRRGAHRWDGWAAWLLVAAFVVAASGLLGVHTLQRSARAADLSADLGAGPVVAVPAVAREAAPPVALVVPDLGIDTRLTGAGTGRDGTLQVPADAGAPNKLSIATASSGTSIFRNPCISCSFGNWAASTSEAPGFAPPPRSGFALVENLKWRSWG